MDPELRSVSDRFNWTVDDYEDSIRFTNAEGKRASARWERDKVGWYLLSRGADGGLDMLSNPEQTKTLALAMTHWNKLYFA